MQKKSSLQQLGRVLFRLRDIKGLGPHDREQLQRKGEAVLALINPVDEHLDVNEHALGFKPTGELLVGEVLLLTKAFDDGLGARLVEIAGLHREQWYMVFDLSTSYALAPPFMRHKSFSIYA